MSLKMFSEGHINMHYDEDYEFCPRCNADLTYQRGFNRNVANWICKGCGEMLINPSIEDDSDIVWICDGCGATLNIQNGFDENVGIWACGECGYENVISEDEVYASEEEYIEKMKNPLNGLSDEELEGLALWSDVDYLSNHENIFKVRNRNTGEICVKKILTMYDPDIYRYLMLHPVNGMPKIHEVYEGKNHLIVIEELISGVTVEEILEKACIEPKAAIEIATSVCKIVKSLHELDTPVIHRDIKPSNIIITENGEIYLLDINAAKWYKPDDVEDTRLMGTHYYAAPEQFGFGYSGSSDKTDIYGIGILLNKMITGKFPKEQKAQGEIWKIIDKCISYEAGIRYSDDDLIDALGRVLKNMP